MLQLNPEELKKEKKERMGETLVLISDG